MLDILFAVSRQILLFKLILLECEELLVMSKDGNDFYLVNNKTTINKASVNVSEKEDTIFTFNELIIESV